MKTLIAFSFVLSAFCSSPSLSQEPREFATKGVVELGGSVYFQTIKDVSNGNIESGSISTFTLSPFVGFFVTDGFELGLNPFEISTISFGDVQSATIIRILAAPSYNFRTEHSGYPFIEGLFGYTAQTGGSSSLSGFSWGGRGGIKCPVTDKGLINVAIQYLLITLNRPDATKRNGQNELSISAGFTVWL